MTKRTQAQKDAGAITDDGIRFSLFAPRLRAVDLQGSWNNFESLPMAHGADGVWWASLTLPDGEHQYRFEVTRPDQQKQRVADPTSIRFAGAGHDCSTVKIVNGQPVYFQHDWQYDDVDLVPNEKLIIYELHIGDFLGGKGTFDKLIDKLDYLAELGVTALELMPATQANPDDNWGYSQYSLYAVDNTYGPPDDLARLIDQCHKRGMRVIHDGVYNHLHEQAPLAQIDFSYWFYEVNPDEPELHFGPKFNYEYLDESIDVYPAREHALGAIHRWISHFHMDGIRFDSTKALKYFDVIGWFNDEAHKRKGLKPFFTIAEHLAQDPTVTGPNGPIDSAWHDTFFRQLRCTLLGIPFDDRQPFNTTELLRVMDARNDGFASNYNVVNYLNNHDQERTMHLLGDKAQVFDEPAFKRSHLGATLLLTAPGTPMLWMGEEFGQATPRGKHTERKPLDWSLLDQPNQRNLWQHYQRLIALRKANPALCSDTFEVLLDDPERGLIAFKRWSSEGEIVIVAANLRPEAAAEIRLDLPHAGQWHEYINDRAATLEGQTLIDTLSASEAKVFIYQPD